MGTDMWWTTMPEVWMLTAAISLVALVSLLSLGMTILVQSRKLSELREGIRALGADFNALCSGAAGVDRRISRLERQGLDLGHRQETLENQRQVGDMPYGEAIQLVQKGASAERLVEELGLSQGEAELVMLLHGMKNEDAASVLAGG
jgi:hypothetical protein